MSGAILFYLFFFNKLRILLLLVRACHRNRLDGKENKNIMTESGDTSVFLGRKPKESTKASANGMNCLSYSKNEL